MHMFMLAALSFALTAAVIGYSKGRNAFGWFACGFFIGPFALIVAGLPPVGREGQFAACPYCKEVIQSDATRCRFCGSPLAAEAERMQGHGAETPPPYQLAERAGAGRHEQEAR